MGGEKTVLVTGGAGFIGSHACKALARAGYRPVTFDSLESGHAWAVKWGPLEQGDILDTDRVRGVLRQHRPAAVLHFAALINVGESVTDPFKYYRTNVAGTLSLLQAMRDEGVDRFVFSSTCAIFGTPERVPMNEDLTQRPVNPYGQSKQMVECLLRDASAAYGLRFVALRYFNAAGADPDGELGERHDPETHLIPLVLDAALGRRPAIQVFGDDYPTPDGTCVRDYIHVSDLADAHVLALDHLMRGGASDMFNLGNGQGFSVVEVIETARAVTGRTIPMTIGPRRPGDPPALVGDPTRARQVLGWLPKRSDLRLQIEDAWRFHSRINDPHP